MRKIGGVTRRPVENFANLTWKDPPIKFSRCKVHKTPLQLNMSKSKGSHSIPAIVRKSCTPEHTPALNNLIQLPYSVGISLSSWKLALIFPSSKKRTNLDL